jgi:hypothetical protein
LNSFLPGWVWVVDNGCWVPRGVRKYFARSVYSRNVWIFSELVAEYWERKRIA